jgi:hypothetical protein
MKANRALQAVHICSIPDLKNKFDSIDSTLNQLSPNYDSMILPYFYMYKHMFNHPRLPVPNHFLHSAPSSHNILKYCYSHNGGNAGKNEGFVVYRINMTTSMAYCMCGVGIVFFVSIYLLYHYL